VVVTLGFWGGDIWVKALGFAVTWHDRPESALTAYQTLNGWLTHLFRYNATFNQSPVANVPGLVGWLWWAVAAVLGTVTIVALWMAREHTMRSRARRLLAPALMVPLALILAPVAADYHFVLTLFPLLVAGMELWEVYGWSLRDPSSVLRPPWQRPTIPLVVGGTVWLIALLLLAAPWRFNVPSVEGWQALVHYPRLYGALALWAVIIGLLLTGRRSVAGDNTFNAIPKDSAVRTVGNGLPEVYAAYPVIATISIS
jgi:hypothetical protein